MIIYMYILSNNFLPWPLGSYYINLFRLINLTKFKILKLFLHHCYYNLQHVQLQKLFCELIVL